MAIKNIALSACIFFTCLGIGFSQEKDDTSIQDAAANSTNPLAFVTKLQFQPNYTFLDGGGDQLSLISRIIQPTKSIGLPFIESEDPSKIYTIYRLEVPIISQTVTNEKSSLNATGISDLILLDAIVFKQDWGLLGVGPAMIFPIASPQVFGSGKLSAGVMAVLLYTKIKGLQIGALSQQFFSVAGPSDRQDVNFMFFQPIVNKILGQGFFIQFNPIMKFDWENNEYTVPLSLAFGKAFAKNLSMNFGLEYVVSGPQSGYFTVRLNINAMFATQ